MQSRSDRLRAWATNMLRGAVLIGAVVVTYMGISGWQQDYELLACTPPLHADRIPVDPFASANGTHLIAYIVTASDCGWSALPSAMEAIRSVRAQLRSEHGESYAQVTVVGVGLDRDLNAGLQFLGEIGLGEAGGAFDQVIVGGSWLNEQIVRFVWREHVAQASTPQILVIERPINTEAYLSASTISVGNDMVVANLSGYQEILAWIEAGMQLDSDRATSAGNGSNLGGLFDRL